MRHLSGRLDWHTEFVNGIKFLLSPISVRWKYYDSVFNPNRDESVSIIVGKATNGFFEVSTVSGSKEYGRMNYDELVGFCNYFQIPLPPTSHGLWKNFESYREKLPYIC